MIKEILEKLCNPLLYYVDKEGHSVFRNYSFGKNDGNMYEDTFSIQKAGKALEYRMETDKKLNIVYALTLILVYLIFIHNTFSIWIVLFCIIVLILLIASARLVCSKLYDNFMQNEYGKFQLIEFSPKITREKKEYFKRSFYTKCGIFAILFILFFMPAILMYNLVKFDINSKKPHFRKIIQVSKIYLTIYPKVPIIYDMRAYARYMTDDIEGSLNDYKTVLNITGKHFTNRDFTRFANLLYLEKKLYGSQNAVDIFNEYYTKKHLNTLEESQLLWMKSIFSVKNNVADFVIQDYDDLLESLNSKDERNRFFISSDKAYMLYLIGDYPSAIEIYDTLIPFAEKNKEKYSKEIGRLYAERGYAKRKLEDNIGADEDFVKSKIDIYDIENYEPNTPKQITLLKTFSIDLVESITLILSGSFFAISR